jgi:hypothetical protein
LNSSGSEQGLVAGSCEHGNKLSVHIKGRDFLDQLIILSTSEEGLCSMQSVINSSDYITSNDGLIMNWKGYGRKW